MKLKIKCLKSDDFDLSINSDASVDDLKEEIEKKSSIPPTKQRLIYRGKVLKSDKKLKDYSISDGSTVHFIVRKHATNQPRNDEPTPQNSTNSVSSRRSRPTGATAISMIYYIYLCV